MPHSVLNHSYPYRPSCITVLAFTLVLTTSMATSPSSVVAMPAEPPAVAATGGFIMPNSIGFAYEAAAVAACIGTGQTRCPQWTEDDSLQTMAIVERWREGVHAGA